MRVATPEGFEPPAKCLGNTYSSAELRGLRAGRPEGRGGSLRPSPGFPQPGNRPAGRPAGEGGAVASSEGLEPPACGSGNRRSSAELRGRTGAPGRTRTFTLRIRNPALIRLSFRREPGKPAAANWCKGTGIEPPPRNSSGSRPTAELPLRAPPAPRRGDRRFRRPREGSNLRPPAPQAGALPLSYGDGGWCPGLESNQRHHDFQSCALPTELPGRTRGRNASRPMPPQPRGAPPPR